MDGKSLPRNQVSVAGKAKMALVLAPTPLILTWTYLSSFLSADGRARSTKKSLLSGATSWIVDNLNRRQARFLFGDTRTAYEAFVRARKMEPLIDELEQDAKLLWVTPKENKRVILYLHGGAFLFGCLASAPYFWDYTREVLSKRGKPTDVAMLNYTLVPDAMFPTQLTQAVLAIQHLIKSGIKPENIQLTGDSAGGLLIHQVISHILHPVEGVPRLELSGPFGGAYMMSPWTSLKDSPLIRSNNGRGDILSPKTAVYWGSKVLAGVPDSSMPLLDAVTAPEDWLAGVQEKAVKRVMISAGDAEILRDAIIKYKEMMEKHHKDVTFFLEDHGIHDDPFIVFLAQEKDLGKLTPAIVDFLDQGFSA